MIRYVELAFSAIVALFATYVIFEAASWQVQAKLFPWAIGVPLAALALVQVYFVLRPGAAQTAGEPETTLADQIGPWNPTARRETVRLLFWTASMIVFIMVFGLLIGLPLAMLLYLKLESREKWTLSLALSVSTLAYMYLLFDCGLHMAWPNSIVPTEFVPRCTL
jgi:ABC-type sugar transport system permease subunit